MRTAIISYIGVFIILITIAIISIITMKSSYSELIHQSLDDSIEYSVRMLQIDRSAVRNSEKYILDEAKHNIDWDTPYQNTDTVKNEKFKQDFVQYLVNNIDAKINNLDINIYGADADSGILSVEVTAYFTYPGGQTDKVSSYKTMILDKYNKNN